ncbi:MAG TPA: VanZ family protein [Anaerolineales bacterium]|nr:VanZ family protein [Anaerolineales bacterium]
MDTSQESAWGEWFKTGLGRWWPALLLMGAIFALSSRPSSTLPNLGWADAAVKKGGHVIGYGALAASYWRGFRWRPRLWWLAWALAVVYGLTDEMHQLSVPGRHASGWDVVLFDAPGAAVGLWLARFVRRQRPAAN